MDNITHSLLGAALAKTRLGQASPWAPAALVVAANLPDFENLVLAFVDKPTNMMHHRSVTHAVVGVLVLIPLFTLLVRGLERVFARGRPRAPVWQLMLGVGIAVVSHPVLDWLNTYGVRPWLPFDGTWYHGDLVFIVDPWLWLLLGGATAVAGRRTRVGSLLLGAVALVTSAAVMTLNTDTPAALQVFWPVAVALIVLARWPRATAEGARLKVGRRAWAVLPRGVRVAWQWWQTMGPRHPHVVVGTALGLAVAYVGGLGWCGRTAWRMSEPVIAAGLAPGETILSHTLVPQPASPLKWQVIAETEAAVYRHTFAIDEGPTGVVRLEKSVDDPLVREVAAGPEGRAWRVFARHPVAAIASNGHGRRVYLMDARYGVFPARGFSSFAIDWPANGTAAGEREPAGDGGD